MFGKIFKSYSEKEVKRIMPTVEKINELEPEISKLSDSELRNKTNEFKDKLKNGSSLNDILPEAFAVCREASKRVLGMRHFDVQLIGGIILHQGRIAEMKTGEGKTLVATLPVYLNFFIISSINFADAYVLCSLLAHNTLCLVYSSIAVY